MRVCSRYCIALIVALAAAAGAASGGVDDAEPLAALLSATGLFDGEPDKVRPANLPYTPQYALWSDGAAKRRWLYLPPGTAIDATDPDLWAFPPGTRLWKEFGYERPVETRMIERLADGSWRFAVYVWQDDGRDALLAPAGGLAPRAVAAAPNGRYEILTRDDCRACHEDATTPVLGLSALQWSPDRDPAAPHAEVPRPGDISLRALVDNGLLRNFPPHLLDVPARIAATPLARSALGYLHANCGHCHNDHGSLADLDLVLAQRTGIDGAARVLETLAGRPSEFRHNGVDTRLVAGRPESSMLVYRMRSRNPVVQMPPLGTRQVDALGVALIDNWIQNELSQQKELQK